MKKLIKQILKETTNERMDRLVMDYMHNNMSVHYPYASDPGFAEIYVDGVSHTLLDPRVEYKDAGTKYMAQELVNRMITHLIEIFNLSEEDAETYVFRYIDSLLGDPE